MTFLNILLGKFIAFLITNLAKRNGSTWPGHLVLESNPEFIDTVLKRNPKLKIVLVAGTNGKTTTTKALHHILRKNNIKVIRNDAGANLLNGFASLLIRYSGLNGKLKHDALLFEVDENSLPLILKNIKADSIILLNLFRDQLDRYGEINTTSEKWQEAISKIKNKAHIIANADDPQIVNITKDLKLSKNYFSIEDNLKQEKELSHAVDSTTCPNCQNQLTYSKIAYSHIGNYKCPNCDFKNPKAFTSDTKTQLTGSFNIYNMTATILTAEKVFKIKPKDSIKSLRDFKPAFGRQEEVKVNGRKALILLSKNPTGFNESLKVLLKNKYSNVLFLLNDRIPDGRDISWIWDVDFEMISDKKINTTISGDRVYDLANRLKYADLNDINVNENLDKAIKNAIKKTPKGGTLAILPTYSAMLETRKIITGKSIL